MRSRVVVGLVLWLTAVGTVAGLAWFAIDSAGKSVTALPISQSGVADRLEPSPDPTATPSSATPATAPTTSTAPTGISTLAVSVSTEPSSSRPSASRTTDRPSPTSDRPSTRPSPSPTQTPRLFRATESGGWGTVSIGCRAGQVSLLNASPSQGWRLTPKSNGPPEIEMVFSPSKGKPVVVTGDCVNGRPDISVKQDD